MWLSALAFLCLRSFSFRLTSNSAWEIHFEAPDELGTNMTEFAIGSVSPMARTNRYIQVDSLIAHLGSSLEVEGYYSIPLAAGIYGANLAFLILGRSNR